jgi:hypothetical protein
MTLLTMTIVITFDMGGITYNNSTYNWFYKYFTYNNKQKHICTATIIIVINKVFTSKVFISNVFISKVFISKVFISKSLYKVSFY